MDAHMIFIPTNEQLLRTKTPGGGALTLDKGEVIAVLTLSWGCQLFTAAHSFQSEDSAADICARLGWVVE